MLIIMADNRSIELGQVRADTMTFVMCDTYPGYGSLKNKTWGRDGVGGKHRRHVCNHWHHISSIMANCFGILS